MTISSRTPEGSPHECPICHKRALLEPCFPGGDSVCPNCGHLLWLFRNHVSKARGVPIEQINFENLLSDDIGVDSLDLVELLMEIEEEMDIVIPEDVASSFRSVRDVIEYLRSLQDE